MTAPTPQDIRNAETRQAIADRQNAAYAEAERLALATLGPGWTPWMKLVLIDSDDRRNGNTTPVATVYKVYRGEERLTENSIYLRRMPDGSVRKADNYEELFGDLLTEKHPTRTIEVRGQQVPVGRWELCWSALERYVPKNAEQLAAAREQREERAVNREAEEMPLFSEQVKAEGFAKKKRSR